MIKSKNRDLQELVVKGDKIAEVYLGHVKVWPTRDKLSDYVITEGEWKAGDVVLYSRTTGNKFAVKAEDVDRFHPKLFSPVGVVVIPQSHDVYGNGCAGVMSLKFMNTSNPNDGSFYSNGIYYGYHSSVSLESYFTKIQSSSTNRYYTPNYGPTTSTPLDTIYTNTSYCHFPSDDFNGQTYLKDSNLKYAITTSSTNNSSYRWGISPYTDTKENESLKNPDFFNASSQFFNGKEYQKVWESLCTTSNWKTNPTISNTYSTAGHYPPFMCAWRYHTDGTEQGDWYIPCYSEFAYIFPMKTKIQKAITKTCRHFFGVTPSGLSGICLCSNYASFSTNANRQYYINLTNGLKYGAYGYNNNYYALAFTQLKSDIDDRPMVTIKVNVKPDIKHVILYVDSESFTFTETKSIKVLIGSKIRYTVTPEYSYVKALPSSIEEFRVQENYEVDYELLYNDLDILMHDLSDDSLFITSVKNLQDYPKGEYKPVGIVVVPAEHDVYGTGEMAACSLTLLSWSLYAQKYDKQYSQYRYVNSILNDDNGTINRTNQSIATANINGSGDNYNFATTSTTYMMPNYEGSIICNHDKNGSYRSTPTYFMSSPFLTDKSRNPNYYSGTNNAFSDFNGKNNTYRDALNGEDYKIPYNVYYNFKGIAIERDTNFTDANATTIIGENNWYVPSLGEFGYYICRRSLINDILLDLRLKYALTNGCLTDDANGFRSPLVTSTGYGTGMYGVDYTITSNNIRLSAELNAKSKARPFTRGKWPRRGEK